MILMKKIYIALFIIIAVIIIMPMKVEAATYSLTGGDVVITIDGEIMGRDVQSLRRQYTYTGEKITPNVSIRLSTELGGVTLSQGKDFAVQYGENIKAGTKAGKIIISSMTNSEYITKGDSRTIYFDITENDSNFVPGEYNPFEQGDTGSSELISKANVIVNVIRNVGMVIAVIALMIIGLKAMVLSASEKATYKQAMPGYILGVFMVAAMSYIPSLIYNIVYKWN